MGLRYGDMVVVQNLTLIRLTVKEKKFYRRVQDERPGHDISSADTGQAELKCMWQKFWLMV